MTCRRLRRKARRWCRRHPLAAAGVAVVMLALVVNAGHAAATPTPSSPAPSSPAAAQIIAYARAQEGCPYVWGGTGPCGAGYDCSGLAMQAYASAGITIERTSQKQWASEPRTADPGPGDLVFFAGSDGTDADPGHVGIVVDPATHTMIDAYATGYPITEETYGLPTSRDGLADPVGFTAPGGGQ